MDANVQRKLLNNFPAKESFKNKSVLPETRVPELKLLTPGRNKFVSSKVEVRCDDTVGRHVVALEDIEVGEVIVEEEPLSSVLHASKLSSNCSRCLKSVIAGVGCDNCTQVSTMIIYIGW